MRSSIIVTFFFFFQAEDGIRGLLVTGVQTCALPILLTSFTGWSSERCPGIGFLSREDREIGVLRNVEPPTRPRLECLRETGLILRCDRKVGNPLKTKQGSRPSCPDQEGRKDRKSTRLNSSHQKISYAVFCLKKKKR